MDGISSVAALVTLLEKVSSWPFSLVLLVVMVGPWIMAVFLANFYRRRYESNVRLVKSYVGLVEQGHELSSDLKEVIILNTQTMQQLVGDIQTNQYCPAVRLEKQAVGVVK